MKHIKRHSVESTSFKVTRQFWAVLMLVGLSIQMFSFSVSAQSSDDPVPQKPPAEKEGNTNGPLPPKYPAEDKPDGPVIPRIAPDLDENVDQMFFGSRPDSTQRVIITLRDAESLLDEPPSKSTGILVGDLASQTQISTKLAVVGGRMKHRFVKMGMVSADLPLSKVRELANDDSVAYISPDRPVQATDDDDDDDSGKYSHYYKTTGGLDGYREIEDLRANGEGIGVAVLDSGIDVNHKLIKPAGVHPGVVYSKSFTNLSATDDQYGHGTFVAALLSGSSKLNGNRYGGIAQAVKIINLAVLDAAGNGSTSNAIAALDWVIANKSIYNIRIINMSLGTPARDSYINDPLCIAVRRAFNAGIVVVVSAGNSGKDDLGVKMYGSINSPGIEPSAITVGAANSLGTDSRADDAIATYSAKGPTRGYRVINDTKVYDNLIKPDLVAPGNKLISAISDRSRGRSSSVVGRNPSLDTRNSSKTGEGLMYMSGTSMAAPLVSGAAAMMLQANPSLTPNLVKASLMFTAQQLRGYNSFEQGAGLLNIDGAMNLTKNIRPNVSSLSNGSSMLTGSPDYYNSIQNKTVYWSRGVITNYAMFCGDNLVKYYQGMYGNGVLMSDSTPFVNGQLTRSTSLTTSGLNLTSGSLTGNGVLLADGVPFINSTSLGDGVTLGNGVLLSDGVLVGDGVLISDNVASLSILGDPTVGMELED